MAEKEYEPWIYRLVRRYVVVHVVVLLLAFLWLARVPAPPIIHGFLVVGLIVNELWSWIGISIDIVWLIAVIRWRGDTLNYWLIDAGATVAFVIGVGVLVYLNP